MKPLLMMRTRGLSGPLFAKHSNCGCLSKSSGNAVSGAVSVGPPVWSAIPDTNVPQAGTWTVDLNVYTTGTDPMTFALNTGAPPTGITLQSDGTFSGTVTNVSGAGSITYTATNSFGMSISATHNWTIS